MTVVDAYVALGSNEGDRMEAIAGGVRALDRRPGVAVRAVSRVRETEPVILAGRPPQRRYLNAAVALETTLSPRALLDACLAIEVAFGRRRDEDEERWGPRRLDLDLLMYGSMVIDEPGLHVPHPRMHERAFVLEPLADIAPELLHPVRRRRVDELLAGLTAPLSQDETSGPRLDWRPR